MESIKRYLDDLEYRIDDEQEIRLAQEWENFARGGITSGYFSPKRNIKKPALIDWPRIMINDAIEDYELMILSQLKMCSDILASGGGEMLCVRANSGTGIIPTMFGAPFFIMPYENDTLPCTRNLEREEDTISKLLERGIPDLRSGLGKKVFGFAMYLKELIRDYPMIQKHVHVYSPDLQGPLPITENLMGSNMYVDLYDEPEEVENMMQLVTDTFIAVQREWYYYYPPYSQDMCVDWGMLHKGNVLIRNDAAMNISGACYERFVQPYDQQILNAFRGGVIHFCGKGDHYIDKLADLKQMYAINMSQPQWNDMSIIYKNTVDKGIQIIGLDPAECERAVREGIELKGNVYSGISLSAWIKDK